MWCESEDRGQKSENRGQRAEVREQRTEGRRQRTENRGQKSDDRWQRYWNMKGEKAKGKRLKAKEVGGRKDRRLEGKKLRRLDFGLCIKVNRGKTSAPSHPKDPNETNDHNHPNECDLENINV